jgi:hypothetical protein
MTWIVGIDEAGYGPNLGPLVMTSVACRLKRPASDFWHLLRDIVRRTAEPEDDRIMVEDSKVVYSTARGLHDLEHSVLTFLCPWHPGKAFRLGDYIARICPDAGEDLQAEPWYSGKTRLPLEVKRTAVKATTARWTRASEDSQLHWGLVRSVVICPARFNHWLDHWGSKGAVLGEALAVLLGANRAASDGTDPMHFFIDKHGGRNTYAAMLQHALADGMVVAHEEGSERSVYSVLAVERDMRLTFQPRADAEHFCVALASMFSKYLRELLMFEFNRFWQTHVPGLKPTAGYPGDADRFFEAIRPAARRLTIPEVALWRRK